MTWLCHSHEVLSLYIAIIYVPISCYGYALAGREQILLEGQLTRNSGVLDMHAESRNRLVFARRYAGRGLRAELVVRGTDLVLRSLGVCSVTVVNILQLCSLDCTWQSWYHIKYVGT